MNSKWLQPPRKIVAQHEVKPPKKGDLVRVNRKIGNKRVLYLGQKKDKYTTIISHYWSPTKRAFVKYIEPKVWDTSTSEFTLDRLLFAEKRQKK